MIFTSTHPLRKKYFFTFWFSTHNFNSFYIWVLISSFFFYQFILRTIPSVIADDLMKEFSITGLSVGVIFSFYYYGYILMQIPVGILLDRFGLRFPLAFGVLLCIMGVSLFIIGENIILLSFGRFLMGVGSAFGFLSCVKVATLLFPSQQIGLIIALSVMIGNLGGMSGGAPFAVLAFFVGWRKALIVLGIMGFFIGLLNLIFLPNFQKNKLQSRNHFVFMPSLKSFFKDITLFLKNSQTWLFGFYGLFMQMSVSTFVELWGSGYLVCAYGIGSLQAANMISFVFVGMIIGAPLLSWITDIIQSHRKVMIIGSLVLSIILFIVIYLSHFLSFFILYVLLFSLGVAINTQIFAFAGICEINPKAISGTASGVHNMMCMISGIIFQPFIGFLLDWQKKRGLPTTPSYSLCDYYIAFSIIPIGVALAAILAFFMKETYNQKKY